MGSISLLRVFSDEDVAVAGVVVASTAGEPAGLVSAGSARFVGVGAEDTPMVGGDVVGVAALPQASTKAKMMSGASLNIR